MRKIIYEDLVFIHDWIIEDSGGLPGIKSESAVHSAIERPFQTAFGKEAYPSIFDKAAAILDSIANNHCFNDASKRTGMAAAAFFLYLNGQDLSVTNKEYEEFMLHVVNVKPSNSEISTWLEAHSKNK